QNHRLTSQLEQAVDELLKAKDDSPQPLDDLKQTAQVVGKGLRTLQTSFRDAVSIQADRARDAKNLRDIPDLLALPLIRGSLRASLRRTYIEIASQASEPSVKTSSPDA